MALVGDIIIRTRAKIPDLPQRFPAPSGNIPTATAVVGANPLPAATYFLVFTVLNQWGETTPSTPETQVIVAANQVIQLTGSLIGGATRMRCYFATASGAQQNYVEFTTLPVTISSASTAPVQQPPINNTAYLPDSDGLQFGASTVYDWLNDALVNLSRAVGGLLDYCGVPTVSGQPLYVLPGEWMEISDVWYGGYWIKGGQRQQFFRRNAVTTDILSSVTISVFTEKQIMEVSYQPDRDSGITNTTVNMGATDGGVAILDSSVFLLPFGFAQIGTEIVSYSDLSFGLGGLRRGLGGSVAQAWPSGTQVTELSLFWCGKRIINPTYATGQSTTQLACPIGWESIVWQYMLGLSKYAERDYKAGDDLTKSAISQAKEWLNGNRGVARFVQVGGYGGANSPQTFDQTIAGGLIVP